MSREKNLVKNTGILALGNFIPKFIAVILTPILTAQLTKAEYGQYDLFTTIISLLLPAATLQISSAVFRFLIGVRGDREACARIISTVFAFLSVTSIITSIVFYFVYGKSLGTNGVLLSVYLVIDIIAIVSLQIMRGLGKNLFYSVSIIVSTTVKVLSVVALLGVFHTPNLGLTGVLSAMILSSLTGTVFRFIWGKLHLYLHLKAVSRDTLKELLAYSWPMVPNNLSTWVLKLSDRVVITAVLGLEATALYGVANKMPSIFSAVQSTFIHAWQENASLASKDEDAEAYYSQMSNVVFRLLITLMAGLTAALPVIWRLLVRGDYEEAYYQVPVLLIASLFTCMSQFVGGIYIANMKTKSVGLTTTIAAVMNFLIDVLFVRSIGIWAGSVSTLVSYAFLLFYRMYDVQKFQKVHFQKRIIFVGIAVLALMGVLSIQRTLVFDLINVAVFAVLAVTLSGKYLADLTQVIKKKLHMKQHKI